MLRIDIEHGDPIGTHQPFIAGGHREIGLHRREVEWHRPQRLRQVEHQCRTIRPRLLSYGHQIHHPPVGPVIVGHGHNCRIRPDRVEHRLAPTALRRTLDGDDLPAAFGRLALPGIDVRRKLVAQRDDFLSLPHRKIGRCHSHAVAGRRDHRDAMRIHLRQPCRLIAERLGHAEEIGRAEIPRLFLQPRTFHHRRTDFARQRCHVSAIEVVDVLRDREAMMLRGDVRQAALPLSPPRPRWQVLPASARPVRSPSSGRSGPAFQNRSSSARWSSPHPVRATAWPTGWRTGGLA